jgi:chemotaxis protein MotA
MDIATIVGILVGFGCLFVAIMADGGQFGAFFHVPAIVIVVGGTLAATCVHFSLGQVLSLMNFIKKTFLHKSISEAEAIQEIIDCAAISRREGALAIQNRLKTIKDGFLVRGLYLVIDGSAPEAIHGHLQREISNLAERHFHGKKMLEFMGGGCPAFGMVGTLVGLVQMFSNMESPEQIGKGMAVALVCTFYGAFVANLFFLPLAGKLGIRSRKEVFLKTMIMEGVLGIARGDGPTQVREVMETFVSERGREEIKANVTARKAA